MDEPKFKVGDKVRVIDEQYPDEDGNEYDVIGYVNGDGSYKRKLSSGGLGVMNWFEDEFELYEDDKQ